AAGQAELRPDQGVAGGELGRDERRLRRVGGLDVQVEERVGERRDRGPRGLGAQELGRNLRRGHAQAPFCAVVAANRAVTPPRWPNSARNTSPGATGIILCTAPGKMMSPACRLSPNWAILLASQATQRTGLPRAAAPAPVSASSPFLLTTTPMSRGSMSVTLRMLAPTTSRPQEALSATVSTSLISQLATRLSTISTDGSAPAIAVMALAAVTPGP